MFPGTASQERLPKQNLEEQLQASFWVVGWQAGLSSKVPGQGCKKGSKNGFPSKVPKNKLLMFPGTAAQEQLPKQDLEEQLQARLQARTESQARLRKTGPEQGPNEQVSSKVPKQVPQEQASKKQVRKQGFQEQVPRQGSKNSEQNTAKLEFF